MTYEEWLQRVGLNINHARCEVGLTQSELSKKIGCAQATLSQIECGMYLSTRSLWRISEALEWPVAALVEESEDLSAEDQET